MCGVNLVYKRVQNTKLISKKISLRENLWRPDMAIVQVISQQFLDFPILSFFFQSFLVRRSKRSNHVTFNFF